jgi:apolipoprotein N-acyltransferase
VFADPNACEKPRTPLLALPYPTLMCVLAAILSGFILWTVFPPAVPGSDGAWFALAPLLLVIRHTSPRRAFWFGWLSGSVCWLLSLTWLWRLIWNNGPWPLVAIGHVGLALYCGLYTGLFALAAARLWQVVYRNENAFARITTVVIGEPLLWVGAEFLRCTLFSGFAWNALGVTQKDNLGVIQVASIGGVYAVSAIILLINSAVTSAIERVYGSVHQRTYGDGLPCGRWRTLETLLPLIALATAWTWGRHRVEDWKQQCTVEPEWRVALVQPNAPPIFERDDENVKRTRDTLLDLTQLSASFSPDLVVWPESSLLGVLPWDADAMSLASNGAVTAHAALLTGSVEIRAGPSGKRGDELFYNSAWLFTSNGVACDYYRKQHLVPFGEYVPGDNVIKPLTRLSPIGYSCTPGRESTIMYVLPATHDALTPPPAPLAFSPLICFEDTVAPLARKAVHSGARLLVNITNDAWFKGSTEPEQHMAQALFRCIETGVPMVRAANTGVSCAIDPIGRRTALTNNERTSGFAGFYPVTLNVPRQPLPAPYRRWGDWSLGIPAAIALVLVLAVPLVFRTRRS